MTHLDLDPRATPQALSPQRPRLGVVAMAYGGYNLGEEMLPAKQAQAQAWLGEQPLELVWASNRVLDQDQAFAAGQELQRQDVDGLLVVLATFVPDYFIVELLRGCDKPVFIYAIEREIQCLSLVCGPLLTGALYNLRKHYHLVGADLPDAQALEELLAFARGAMLARLGRTLRVGYSGGKCPIMLSLAPDLATLTHKMGTPVIEVPMEEFYAAAGAVSESDARMQWQSVRSQCGSFQAADADGLLAGRYLLAARQLVKQYRLDAWSLNCFPHLKSKICVPLAQLNDMGVAAACEGDLHSTILMAMLARLTGRAAFNGDFLRLYEPDNDVLFSHCGCGAFSLAHDPAQICLRCSIETRDGLAVLYATDLPGPVTLLNLMAGRGDMRLAAMTGRGVATNLEYEGTPLRVHFDTPVRELVRRVAHCGAGHHWNAGPGDHLAAFAWLCRLSDIPFHPLTRQENH